VRANPLIILKFLEVTFIDCPTDFRHAQFSIAVSRVVEGLRRRVAIEEKSIVFAILAESSGQIEEQTFIIVADGMLITEAG
jgi:hypothetical protein